MAEKSKEFGERLKCLIEKSDMNVNGLAKKIHVIPITIWNYIKEGRIPEAPILYNLSKEFGISMEELLTGRKNGDHASPAENLLRIDDYLDMMDGRYAAAKRYLDQIFKSQHEDIKKAILSNLEVFAGTVNERNPPQKKKTTPGK